MHGYSLCPRNVHYSFYTKSFCLVHFYFLLFLYWAKLVLILQVHTGDDDNDRFPEFILCRVRVLATLPVARRRNSPDTPPSSSSCR